MVDMYRFETDGKLAGVCNYLRSHGGFEIEQVTNLNTYGGGHASSGRLVNCDQSVRQATGRLLFTIGHLMYNSMVALY